MKGKLKLIIPLVVLLVVGGGAYKFVLAKPKEEPPKPHVEGTVYVLGKEFLVNLADGRFAKFSVALVLDPHDTSTAPLAGGGHGPAPQPPEGYGAMHQEAIIRDIVVDKVTNAKDDDLIDSKGRKHLKEEILHKIHKQTDVHAVDLLFPDMTVQ